MTNQRRKILGICGVFVGLFALLQSYTNCSKSEVNMNEGSSVTLNQNHPNLQASITAQYNTPLGHKKFIASIMRDTFTNSASTAEYLGAVDGYTTYWADRQGTQLGLACNPYESQTGQDCGGSISNSNSAISSVSTTIREAIRIHLCDEILGYENAVTAALANAHVTAATPDENSIRAVTGLFYRGELPSQEFISTFVEMDQHLSAEGLGNTDRWRMILVELCETTEWQRL
ncbi:MAG: hypothetical protein ACXVA9_06420 [Bdellovibrionales bacterium]